MPSMESHAGRVASTSPRPSRQLSRRQALPRRSTKGPLGESVDIDDPLSIEPEPQQEPESDVALSSGSSSQLLSVSDIKPLPSPQPQTPPVQGSSVPAIAVVERPSKNFSYLLKPENFLPVNDQDIPSPFRQDTATNQTPSSIDGLQTLLSTGHFRAAAALSASLLKSTTDPTNHPQIFHLLHTRLACLQLLNLEHQAAQEAKCLQDLNAPFYRDRTTTAHLVPWDLRVLAVRLHAIGFGDWRRGIMAYYDLARDARFEVRKAATPEEKRVWKRRLGDLGMRVGNALMEIGDVEGAVRHFEGLQVEGEDGTVMRMRIAFALLKCGDVQAAEARMQGGSAAEDTPGDASRQIMQALIEMSKGNFAAAIDLWQNISPSTADISPEDMPVITQNLALCHLYTGDIQKARQILESLQNPPNANNSNHQPHIPTLTFNLCTIYELLCSEKRSRELKLKLAERVAERRGTEMGWEGGAEFKL